MTPLMPNMETMESKIYRINKSTERTVMDIVDRTRVRIRSIKIIQRHE